jgi:SHO1 osmosensor
MYDCRFSVYTADKGLTMTLPDSAVPDDPTEISFQQGEILDVLERQGVWWQVKKGDGSVGSKSPFFYKYNPSD